jgi:hypothetical protein
MPELVMNGSIDPATVDPRCFAPVSISGLSESLMKQAQSTVLIDDSYAILALADTDGRSVRVANGDLALIDGQLTGDVGCNRFGADATLAEDGTITISGGIFSTLMFCPDRNAAEQLFSAILRGGGLVFDRTTGVIRGNAGSILLGEKTVAPIEENDENDSIDGAVDPMHAMHEAHHRDDTSLLVALIAGVIGGFLAGYSTARRQSTPVAVTSTPRRRTTRRVRRTQPSVKKTEGGAR